MTDSLVSLELKGSVATLTMDDGKRNALSPAMLDAIYGALERAEKERVALVITGREGVLSAGFDLKVMKAGGLQALTMLRKGYALTERLLSFPTPVVIASPGHAYAMGVFLLLSGDYRFGVPGPYTYVANEVAIGLPMPRVACEVMRLRLNPAARERAVTLSEEFSPEQALEVGFIDALVPAEDLLRAAREKAGALFELLDADSHALSKKRLRADTLKTIRTALPLDLKDAVVIGAKRVLRSKRAR
jgi:enoyl-CoA hydratase